MNIIYATRATIPYPSAASLNTVQMCQSLVELGHHVTLAVGRKFWRWPQGKVDWAGYYGIPIGFRVERIPELPRTGWWFDQQVVRRAQATDAMIYLRYPRLLTKTRQSRVPTLLELHSALTVSQRRLVSDALRSGTLRGVVTITDSLRQDCLRTSELSGLDQFFLVAPDAVDWRRFSHLPVADHANSRRVGYVGGLFPGKGMEQILLLAERMSDVEFDVFGGRQVDLRGWSARGRSLSNLHLHGRVAPAQVPACLQQFGIALLPNQAQVMLPNGDDIGRYTSPMKLFEYMAAGRAIVASDLPPLREVLTHEQNCLLVPPGDTCAWESAIRRLQTDDLLRTRIATTARLQAQSRVY
jgi:glycosyltransferase involved in cell wall biosynthesis